jgi:hypothetical protein
MQILDAGRGQKLQPNRLPDTETVGVVATAGVKHELAVHLPARVRRVRDLHDNLLRSAGNKEGSDIETKSVIAAQMGPQFPAVEINRRIPIHRTEMEHETSPFPDGGNIALAGVPKAFGRHQRTFDSREGGFNRVRNKNLACNGGGSRFGVFVGDRVIPQAIQIEPIRAYQSRTRIIRQRMLGRNVRRPFRQKRTGYRFPDRIGVRKRAEKKSQRQTDSPVDELRIGHSIFPILYSGSPQANRRCETGMWEARPYCRDFPTDHRPNRTVRRPVP